MSNHLHIVSLAKLFLLLYSAVRYCGATFTFTSASILLNYSTRSELFSPLLLWVLKRVYLSVSPPPVVGMANGVAQSIVSLARGFGPIIGGYVRDTRLPYA